MVSIMPPNGELDCQNKGVKSEDVCREVAMMAITSIPDSWHGFLKFFWYDEGIIFQKKKRTSKRPKISSHHHYGLIFTIGYRASACVSVCLRTDTVGVYDQTNELTGAYRHRYKLAYCAF